MKQLLKGLLWSQKQDLQLGLLDSQLLKPWKFHQINKLSEGHRTDLSEILNRQL